MGHGVAFSLRHVAALNTPDTSIGHRCLEDGAQLLSSLSYRPSEPLRFHVLACVFVCWPGLQLLHRDIDSQLGLKRVTLGTFFDLEALVTKDQPLTM